MGFVFFSSYFRESTTNESTAIESTTSESITTLSFSIALASVLLPHDMNEALAIRHATKRIFFIFFYFFSFLIYAFLYYRPILGRFQKSFANVLKRFQMVKVLLLFFFLFTCLSRNICQLLPRNRCSSTYYGSIVRTYGIDNHSIDISCSSRRSR